MYKRYRFMLLKSTKKCDTDEENILQFSYYAKIFSISADHDEFISRCNLWRINKSALQTIPKKTPSINSLVLIIYV